MSKIEAQKELVVGLKKKVDELFKGTLDPKKDLKLKKARKKLKRSQRKLAVLNYRIQNKQKGEKKVEEKKAPTTA